MRGTRQYVCTILFIIILFGLGISSLAANVQDETMSKDSICTITYTEDSGTVQYVNENGNEVVESISFHPAPVPIEPVDYKINFGNPIRTTEYTDKNGNDVVENLYYSPGPVPAAPANYEVEFGDPIRILEYVDEYGNEVTEKIYFCPIAGTSGSISFLDADDSIDVSGSGGAGWYQNEKKLDNSRDQPTYIYVKAYFTWKDGDVSVSNASGWVEGLASGVKVISESVTTGTDSALFTGKYAYAKYSLTTQNLMTIKQNDSVAVKVRYRNIS